MTQRLRQVWPCDPLPLESMVRNTTFNSAPPEFLEFVVLSAFERQAIGLLEEEDLHRLEQRLLMNPTAGSVVPGTGGIRKLRVPAKGRGTRGGARVIYYLRNLRSRIYLVPFTPRAFEKT